MYTDTNEDSRSVKSMSRSSLTVEDVLGMLSGSFDDLENTLSTLENRVKGAMRAPEPTPGGIEAPDRDESNVSPLTQTLLGMNYRLRRLTSSFGEITERVDL